MTYVFLGHLSNVKFWIFAYFRTHPIPLLILITLCAHCFLPWSSAALPKGSNLQSTIFLCDPSIWYTKHTSCVHLKTEPCWEWYFRILNPTLRMVKLEDQELKTNLCYTAGWYRSPKIIKNKEDSSQVIDYKMLLSLPQHWLQPFHMGKQSVWWSSLPFTVTCDLPSLCPWI